MALILPKGIVKNSALVEGQIESIDTEPLDLAEIAKFWKVYTTTSRRLLDPTAERLENYWWRIWGSRRRELNGATVARLFAYISDGQSFVPLRGPANRDEGSAPMNRPSRTGPGAASTATIHRPSQSRPSTTSSSTTSKAPIALPPILKKGPSLSTTTPRTARFISPHESEAETNTNSSTKSISPNSHVVVQPPSPDSQNLKPDKKAAIAGGVKKKGQFFASTATKKKRPLITRRQSSQSSADSASKIEAKIEAQTAQSSTERSTPTFSDDPHGKGKAHSQFQETFSLEQLDAVSPIKRPSSKKPSRKSKGDSNQLYSLNDPSLVNLKEGSEDGQPGPSSKLRSIQNQQTSLVEDLTKEELNELELQHTLLEDASARKKNLRSSASGEPFEDLQVPQKSIHSTPVSRPPQQDQGAIRMLPHEAKGTARVALASAEATGQLGLSDPITLLPQVTGAEGRNKGKGRDPNEIQRTELFAKRPVPPISTVVAPIPTGDSLARSKSQLTLLLEKDRARSTDKKRDRKKE